MAAMGSDEPLEDKLRQMLLSNVRIGHDNGSQSDSNGLSNGSLPNRGSHRGRGRGFEQRPLFNQYASATQHNDQRTYNRGRGGHYAPSPAQGQQLPEAQMFRGRGRGGRGGYSRDHSNYPNPARADPHTFTRGSQQQHGNLWMPSPGPPMQPQHHAHNQHYGNRSYLDARARYLESLALSEISKIEMSPSELMIKDSFRSKLNDIFVSVQAEATSSTGTQLALQSFGSLKSGFATAGSDMDLVIVDIHENASQPEVSLSADGLPRLFEKHLLDKGFGARLLTRARVPIIKVCEEPHPELLQALRDARAEWDALPEDEQVEHAKEKKASDGVEAIPKVVAKAAAKAKQIAVSEDATPVLPSSAAESTGPVEVSDGPGSSAKPEPGNGKPNQVAATDKTKEDERTDNKTHKSWSREKKKGPLDFPSTGVGIQCDINFFNPLGLYNTHMLHCYSLCDPRVRQMILFVKSWARIRKINTPYSGTLSSYGYVLMVLHYLVNVARPPVLPNLQLEAARMNLPGKVINGWEVRFWSNEDEIRSIVARGAGSQNRQSLGMLLHGFFQHYATTHAGHGFVWMRDVLSLRTPGGIQSKQQKGWTEAKTETTETREVRHRYLFAIEDPFELTHNVARTVTHKGIVAIRDEFRRVWRILVAVGQGGDIEEDLLAKLQEDVPAKGSQHATAAVEEADGAGHVAAVEDVAVAAEGAPDAVTN